MEGKIQELYTGPESMCELCYDEAVDHPDVKFEFSHCQYVFEEPGKMRKSNLLDKAETSSVLSPSSSNVQYLRDMNTAQISIWSIIFGGGFLVVFFETFLGYSLPKILGLTSLHVTRYNWLMARGYRINMENMCSFGLTEEFVRLGVFHYRTVASILTIPITMAVMNEHFRYVIGPGGCYRTVGYPFQSLVSNLYYIEAVGMYLLLYVTALLVVLLIICYCCRKHLYQLIRICFLVFFVTAFSLQFLATFFLLTNAVKKSEDRTHIIFSIIATVSVLEAEWIILSPFVCKVWKHIENMKLLYKHRVETRTLTPEQANECRLVALLRGLGIPSHVLSRDDHKEEEHKGESIGCSITRGDSKRAEKADWERPLEAMVLEPLFDPRVFRIIHEFQASPDAPTRVGMEDFLHYKLWKDRDNMDEPEIHRVKRKLRKHRWKLYDEKEGVEMTPMVV